MLVLGASVDAGGPIRSGVTQIKVTLDQGFIAVDLFAGLLVGLDILVPKRWYVTVNSAVQQFLIMLQKRIEKLFPTEIPPQQDQALPPRGTVIRNSALIAALLVIPLPLGIFANVGWLKLYGLGVHGFALSIVVLFVSAMLLRRPRLQQLPDWVLIGLAMTPYVVLSVLAWIRVPFEETREYLAFLQGFVFLSFILFSGGAAVAVSLLGRGFVSLLTFQERPVARLGLVIFICGKAIQFSLPFI